MDEVEMWIKVAAFVAATVNMVRGLYFDFVKRDEPRAAYSLAWAGVLYALWT